MAIKCPKCHSDNPDTKRFCGECGTQLLPPEKVSVSPTKTLETPKEEFTTGSKLAGRYQIIEELGRGGMGNVYKVYDTEIKEKVALKVLKPEIAADEKTIERFRNELKYARKIAHRNVCRMFDLGEEKGTRYIAMEYVPGEDLKSTIRRIGQLPIGKSISIAKQVCEGLAEAHRLGVVHRDLKPQNIMLDREGNARIMDFGIARSLKAKGITEAGVIIGTPEYMSPEQVEGKDVDQRSDIYSLGVILYEMVTGSVPFEGDTPFIIGMKHKSEEPREPKEFNAQVPADLSLLILKCMEKDRELRYQSAGEVRTELTRIEKEIPSTERVVPKRKPLTLKEIAASFKLKKIFIPVFVFIALLMAGVIIWRLLPQKEAPLIPTGENSVAVLSFADLSPEKSHEYLCDGIAETLINTLSSIKGLRVPARTSAFIFKGREQDIREIGQKLNVRTVLEGSVQVVESRLRITVQLINVDDGYHLWSERYDRELDDVFAIQDEISLAVVDKLKVKLLRGEKAKLVKRHTESLEAYNLYLKGLYFWNKRTGEGMKKGMEHFQKAIENDPIYALAYAGLADAYSMSSFYGWSYHPNDAFPKAKALAEKALEIDNTLAEAHASLAWNSLVYDWDWSAAESGFKRAIELNPGYAMAHHWYALYLAAMERDDEALKEIRRAQELDALSLIISTNVGWIFYHQRNYDQTIEQLKKVLEMNPNFGGALWHIGRAYTMKGKYEEAIESLQKVSKIVPWAASSLGYAFAMSGERDKAEKLLNELVELSKKRYIPPSSMAVIYSGLGEIDKSFEWIEKCYQERDGWMTWFKIYPEIDDRLRSDPRFKIMLKKMGLE